MSPASTAGPRPRAALAATFPSGIPGLSGNELNVRSCRYSAVFTLTCEEDRLIQAALSGTPSLFMLSHYVELRLAPSIARASKVCNIWGSRATLPSGRDSGPVCARQEAGNGAGHMDLRKLLEGK